MYPRLCRRAINDAVGSIIVDTRPIVVTYIKHEIVDDNNFPFRTNNDGLYRIDWSISEHTRFYSGGGAVPMADAMYGTARTGVFIPLDPPIAIRDTLVINVKVINAWGPRVGDFRVQVLFHGYEKKPQSWNFQTEGPA